MPLIPLYYKLFVLNSNETQFNFIFSASNYNKSPQGALNSKEKALK